MAIQQSQVRALAKMVARAFAAADLPDEVRHSHKIELTNLLWQVPPLMTGVTLGGEPLEEYFNHPLSFDPKDMMKFWQQAMIDLWHQPSLAIKGGTYRGISSVLKSSKIGSRVFRFALPPGCPGPLGLTSGIQLSLEVAHAVFVSLPIRRRELTIDSYWVETADGQRFGVQDGRPLVDSPWTYEAKAEVLDFLELARGPVSVECHHDQLAALRSILHVHKSQFRSDFAGLDMALQALRYLSWGTHCPDMVTAVQEVKTDMPLLRMREQAMRDAREAMESTRLNDKQKLETIRTLLVPTVMGLTKFRRFIYASDHFPFTLTRDKDNAIREWLREYYETEVPENLRRMA